MTLVFLYAVLAALVALIPDAHCDGCPPPVIPRWVLHAIAVVSMLIQRMGG